MKKKAYGFRGGRWKYFISYDRAVGALEMKQLIMVQGEVDKDCEQTLKSFMQRSVAPIFFFPH